MPVLLVVALAAGCSSRDTELNAFIAKVKAEPAGGVEPLQPLTPADSFLYEASDMRSPFAPGGTGVASAPTVRRNSKRNREFLEGYSLDTLQMKGVISINGRTYGLVQTRDNVLQKVLPGNYLGQNEGRIDKVEPTRITITEIVPDGLGGFMERAGALALPE